MRRFATIPQHTHRCDCQRAELTCYEPADQCEIRIWRCPKCEDDQLEADIIQLANEQTLKETTRAESE